MILSHGINSLNVGGSSYKGVISTGFCTLTDGRYLTDFDNSSSTVTFIYGLSLNGKSVTIEFNVCITEQSGSNYSICGPNINNYQTFAIQYRSTSKEIWFAAPNATQNAWQSEGWKSCDLGIGVYHKLRLEYIKDTNTLNGYVDDVLITTSQLSDIPNASYDTLKLGMNYQTQFALQGIIDLSKSYIEADGVRQFN